MITFEFQAAIEKRIIRLCMGNKILSIMKFKNAKFNFHSIKRIKLPSSRRH